MDRKELLALVGERADDVASYLDSEINAARAKGHDANGFDKRQLEKALKDLQAAQAQVTSLEESSKKAAELEKSLKAAQEQNSRLAPMVEKYRGEQLRTQVTASARLKNPIVADALILRMGLSLDEGDTLKEEHVKALEEWSALPENTDLVVQEKADTLRPGSRFATPPPATGAGKVPPGASKWLNRLSDRERAVAMAGMTGKE